MPGGKFSQEREGPLGDDWSPGGPVGAEKLEQKALEVSDGRRQLFGVGVDASILRRVKRQNDRVMNEA